MIQALSLFAFEGTHEGILNGYIVLPADGTHTTFQSIADDRGDDQLLSCWLKTSMTWLALVQAPMTFER